MKLNPKVLKLKKTGIGKRFINEIVPSFSLLSVEELNLSDNYDMPHDLITAYFIPNLPCL